MDTRIVKRISVGKTEIKLLFSYRSTTAKSGNRKLKLERKAGLPWREAARSGQWKTEEILAVLKENFRFREMGRVTPA